MTGPASTDGRALTESPKPRQLEPLSADRYGVHFTADGDFRDLLERVRGLAGHRLPSGDLMTLIKRGLEAYERELEKERFALGRKPRTKRAAPSTNLAEPAVSAAAPALHAASPSETTPSETTLNPRPISSWKRKRHYSAEVVREVFARDGKQCTYVSPDGRRCCARRCLELDHVDPWAVGGEETVCNLRLRCRAHNQWYARLYFGRARVEASVRCSRAARAQRC